MPSGPSGTTGGAICPLCPASGDAKRFTALTGHLKARHAGEALSEADREALGLWSCSECVYYSTTEKALWYHLRSEHQLKKPRPSGRRPRAQTPTPEPPPAATAPLPASATRQPSRGGPRIEPPPTEITAVPPAIPTTDISSMTETQRHARETMAMVGDNPELEHLIQYSTIRIPLEKIHYRTISVWVDKVGRLCDMYNHSPTEVNLRNILIAPRAILGVGYILQRRGEKGATGKIAAQFPQKLPKVPELQDKAREARGPEDEELRREHAAVTATRRHMAQGRTGRAAKALSDYTPLAEESQDNIESLCHLHPPGEANAFGGTRASLAPPEVHDEQILAAIHGVDPETAAGLSGWSPTLLNHAAKDVRFLRFLRILANQIATGKAQGRDLLVASRLVALDKNPGVRPIAVGDLLLRVASKAILLSLGKTGLLPTQLGVGNPGGVDPVVAGVREAVEGPNHDAWMGIAKLDFSNAFNTIRRSAVARGVEEHAPEMYRAARWAYSTPAMLVTHGGTRLASSAGVRQGDVLGPLLFSLGMRVFVEELQTWLGKEGLAVAYLDDTTVLHKKDGVIEKAAAILERLDIGVRLNVAKSSDTPVQEAKVTGLEILGAVTGPPEVREAFVEARVDRMRTAISRLALLTKQQALIILRVSAQQLLRHLLRNVDPQGVEEQWEAADGVLQGAMVALRGERGRGKWDEEITCLPVRMGGLGLLSHSKTAGVIFRTASAKADALFQNVREGVGLRRGEAERADSAEAAVVSQREAVGQVQREMWRRMERSLSTEEYVAMEENRSFLGSHWLRVLPNNNNFIIADSVVQAALCRRYLVQPPEGPCPICGEERRLNHEYSCQKRNGGKSQRRHNGMRDAIIDALRNSRQTVQKEPQVPDPSRPEVLLRSDLSVDKMGVVHHYDVTVRDVSRNAASTGQVELRSRYNAKVKKYQHIGEAFHPLVISNGGLFESRSAKSFRALQRLMTQPASDHLCRRLTISMLNHAADFHWLVRGEAEQNADAECLEEGRRGVRLRGNGHTG